MPWWLFSWPVHIILFYYRPEKFYVLAVGLNTNHPVWSDNLFMRYHSKYGY